MLVFSGHSTMTVSKQVALAILSHLYTFRFVLQEVI